MQSPASDPFPPNAPHLHNQQPHGASPPQTGDRLLRLTWIVLGGTFVAVFLFALVTILLKGEKPPATEPAAPAVAQNQQDTSPDTSLARDDADHELLPLDTTTKPQVPPAPAEEVHRVLGGGFTTAPADDSLLPAPPPLPAPPNIKPDNPPSPLKRDNPPPPPAPDTPPPAKPRQADNNPAPPPVLSAPANADVAVEKQLQMTEEEAREQLRSVPELRLFSDLEVQAFRETQTQDERTMRRVARGEVDFAFNVQMGQSLRKAGLKEGLPLQTGASTRLDPSAAMIVQTLSKDLRDLGFVSVPGTPVRVRFPGAAAGAILENGAAKDKTDAFKAWCDQNRVEKFRGALATLLQMLQVEDVPTRLLLVRELAKVKSAGASAALAKRAIVDLSPEVRDAAVAALQQRPAGQYLPVLLGGLRYPYAPVADRAALALRKLSPEGAVPKLVALLDQPDPSLPILPRGSKKPLVREMVRLNHMRNCLLCHAPSANDKDGLVRGLVPTPGKPLPRLYYAGQTGNFVRADITFLRQDFSVNLLVEAAAPWPNEQRFDFIARVRPAKPEELKEIADKQKELKEITDKQKELKEIAEKKNELKEIADKKKDLKEVADRAKELQEIAVKQQELKEIAARINNYPQREAVLYTLRGITGKDGGPTSEKWRDLLGIAIESKPTESAK